MLEKTIAFVNRICFEQDIQNFGDCYLQKCKECEQKAWLNEDIKHKRKCEVGVVLKELKMATTLLQVRNQK